MQSKSKVNQPRIFV